MLCLMVTLCYGTRQWGSPGAGVGLAGPGVGLAGPGAGLAGPGAGLVAPGAGLAAPSLIQQEQLPLWVVSRGGRLGGSTGTARRRRLPVSQVTSSI